MQALDNRLTDPCMCILDRHCHVVVRWLYLYRPTFGARFPMRLFSSIHTRPVNSFIYYVNHPSVN